VVEDHQGLRVVMSETLQSAGFDVTALESAEEVYENPGSKHWHLAILDWNLPGENGDSLAARLRETHPHMGIIMLTVRTSLQDKLRGYAGGADLYLTKPAEPSELVAVVNAWASRHIYCQQTAGYTLNLRLALLKGPDGAETNLTANEVTLLHHFLMAPMQQLESWQIIQVLDMPLDEVSKDKIEQPISRLRKKLKAVGMTDISIKAIRGVGYQLCYKISVV
jgi:DNA-binding response OmpR family regulator